MTEPPKDDSKERIAKLEAQIDALQKKLRWLEGEEENPEEDRKVHQAWLKEKEALEARIKALEETIARLQKPPGEKPSESPKRGFWDSEV